MASKDLVFRFLGMDAGAGREFDRMAGKSASLEHAVGKLTLGFAAAGVAMGVESVRAAAKFQTAMELIHTQAGRSQKTVERMSKAVLAMAGPVATGPDELAKGLYHLASTGLSAAKTMTALKIAAEGAKLGGANLEDVTNALNATIVSGIKGSKDFTSAMGMLNATVGAGDMRMQDLAEAMGTGVLTTAKNFGVSLNSVGAALAVFGDNNIRGADAATKLQQAMTYMEKPAAGANKVLKTIGLTSKDLRRDMGSGGLGKTLADLHDHLVKAGDTGTKLGPILLDIFGRKPANAINTLLGQYQRFQSKQEQVHAGSKSFASDWTAYTTTFGYSWDRARAAFESMTIQIGQKLLPTATKAMNWIGTTGVSDLEKFSGWVSRNKTPIEDIAKVLAGIAAFRFASSKLNDVSRLLGFGGKGLGGGGILGSAKPIPVYVTNMGSGGLGGAGGKRGGVSGAERAGEGAAAKGVVGRVAAKVGLQGATKLAGPLYATYLATQGGDEASGQRPAPLASRHDAFAQLYNVLDPKGQREFPQSVIHGGKVNLNEAVSYLATSGTSKQVAQLHELAKTYPQIAAAFKVMSDNEKVFSHFLVQNTGLAKANAVEHRRGVASTIGELKKIPGAMKQLSADAKAAGLTIGQMLDEGVTIGIRRGKGNIDVVSASVVDGVKHSMNARANIQSPSKMTAYIGEMLAAGLALGLRAGKKGVGQATSELMDTVRGNVLGAGSLGNVGSMSPDTLGAMGGAGTSIGQILAFTHGQVRQDRVFARNLAVARKHGLSKSVAQQIAQLGPDQGGTLAASIAGASRGQIHQLNRDEASIGRLGSQIAGTVSLSDTTIAKLSRAIRPHVSVTTPAQLDRHNGKKIMSQGHA